MLYAKLMVIYHLIFIPLLGALLLNLILWDLVILTFLLIKILLVLIFFLHRDLTIDILILFGNRVLQIEFRFLLKLCAEVLLDLGKP